MAGGEAAFDGKAPGQERAKYTGAGPCSRKGEVVLTEYRESPAGGDGEARPSSGLLIASVGTSRETARKDALEALEEAARRAYPGCRVEAAYTSGQVREELQGRGIVVPSPQQALEGLLRQGVQELTVQPTHLLPGREYGWLYATLQEYREAFRVLKSGEPLLASRQDLRETASLLSHRFPRQEGACVLLMGHGSPGAENRAYASLGRLLEIADRPDIRLATLKGGLPLSDALPVLRRMRVRRVLLAPLMVTAGQHAAECMACDGADSWKSRLEAQGFAVEVRLAGLGEDPGFQRLFLRHIAQARPL